jgi:transposase
MSAEGMGAALAVHRERAPPRSFEACVEKVLAPGLPRAGQLVIMDELSAAHKGARVRQLVEERGCELLYLPPYSPGLNPIGEAFGKVKASCARPKPGAGRRRSK